MPRGAACRCHLSVSHINVAVTLYRRAVFLYLGIPALKPQERAIEEWLARLADVKQATHGATGTAAARPLPQLTTEEPASEQRRTV